MSNYIHVTFLCPSIKFYWSTDSSICFTFEIAKVGSVVAPETVPSPPPPKPKTSSNLVLFWEVC